MIRQKIAPQVTLSYVRAYLSIGNINRADESFQTIQKPEQVPGAMLVLAQLRAAKGDSQGAQQAFMFAIDNRPLSEHPVSSNLLDYFCQHKMWHALEGYGENLHKLSVNSASNNAVLNLIGLCFFNAQDFVKAKYWLNHLDLTQPVEPIAYLALARLQIEDNEYFKAELLMVRYEENKKQVDAQSMWISLEVYQNLQKPELAAQIGQQLMALFPLSDFSLVYQEIRKQNNIKYTKPIETDDPKIDEPFPKNILHIIQKGETLYQLSKRYGVTAPELMSWNPDLIVDDIALGTPIRIMAPKTRLE